MTSRVHHHHDGWPTWMVSLLLFAILYITGSGSGGMGVYAQHIQPAEDRCVQEPCVYDLKALELKIYEPFYILLHDVDTADSLSCKVHCRETSLCQGLMVMFLRSSQWANMQNDAAYTPGISLRDDVVYVNVMVMRLGVIDDGSLVNYTRAARTFTAETTITSSQSEYYIVVLNRGPMETIKTDVQVTYRVAGIHYPHLPPRLIIIPYDHDHMWVHCIIDCLLYMVSLLFVPLLLLVFCMCICQRDTTTPSAEWCSCNLCTYEGINTGPPDSYCCCQEHKFPRWTFLCGDNPGEWWKRPIVNWPKYWRQKVLLTWPWNPEKGEKLDLRARQTYVLIVLLFNLLVLTLWSEVLVTANSTVAEIMPSATSYITRYAGSTLAQWLFFITFKPVLTFLFVTGPIWRNSESRTRRFFGFFLVYILQILFLILLAAVTYSVLLLLTQYRCSVLISSLIIPFFCYEVLKMAFVIGVIPLPVWYIFLNAYGPELHPEDYRRYAPIGQPLVHNDAAARGNGGHGGVDDHRDRDVDQRPADQRPLLRPSSPRP